MEAEGGTILFTSIAILVGFAILACATVPKRTAFARNHQNVNAEFLRNARSSNDSLCWWSFLSICALGIILGAVIYTQSETNSVVLGWLAGVIFFSFNCLFSLLWLPDLGLVEWKSPLSSYAICGAHVVCLVGIFAAAAILLQVPD